MKVNGIWRVAYSRCTFVVGRGAKQDILENITADEADKIQSAMLCAIPKRRLFFLYTCKT